MSHKSKDIYFAIKIENTMFPQLRGWREMGRFCQEKKKSEIVTTRTESMHQLINQIFFSFRIG